MNETNENNSGLKRRRRKRTKNLYFTQVHENAILKYVNTDSKKERTELYVRYIGPAFDEMVNKIIFTYKFTTLPNIDYLRDECKVWLTTILDKYDVNKGSKAFSYFSVITKNWFIHKVKKNALKAKREFLYEDLDKEDIDYERYTCINTYEEDREKSELVENLSQRMRGWQENCVRTNDEKVFNAVVVLFENSEDIEIFNKKAIYLYIRELTGLNTKQVVNSLNKMRKKYKDFRNEWEDGLI